MPVPLSAVEKTALYRLFDDEGRLLYVGITNSPDVRWAQHSAEKAWWGSVAERRVEWHDTRLAAGNAEIAAILNEAPIHNVNGSPWAPAPRRDEGVGIRELKARLSDYVGRTIHRDEPVFVTRNGKRVIALVPAEWAERMLAERESGAARDAGSKPQESAK